MKRKYLFFLIAMSLVVVIQLACGASTPDQPDYSKMYSIVARGNTELYKTIRGRCDCDLRDIGVIVVRGEEEKQVLYVNNLETLKYANLFEPSLVFSLQPGDTIYYGKVVPTSRLVQDGTLTAIVDVPNEILRLSGGDLVIPIEFEIEKEQYNSWVSLISGGKPFGSVSDAVLFWQPSFSNP